MQASQQKYLNFLAMLAAAVLPFAFEPQRFEPYEAHKAVLLGLLVLLALPYAFRQLTQPQGHSRPLLAALMLWCCVLIISALFALSPVRAFFGDPQRRMGSLTLLTFVGLALVGRWFNPRQTWRWFWRAGIVVSGYQILQTVGWLNTLPDRRAAGVFGLSTFTGGWLTLVLIWSMAGAVSTPLTGREKAKIYAGLALMLLALVLTETRGAVLAWMAGTVSLALLWICLRRSVRGLMAAASAALIGICAVLVLNAANTGGNLQSIPLLSRVTWTSYDQSTNFRQTTWQNALLLTTTWPRLQDLNGQPDAWAALRPVIGYGADLFEIPHRTVTAFDLYLSVKGQRIDRAHNEGWDTLVMTGWTGVLARLAIWVCAWLVGLRRLGLRTRWSWLWLVLGGAGGLFLAEPSVRPLAVSIGLLAGGWFGLIVGTFRRPPEQPIGDLGALIALSVLSASLMDLQFAFSSTATAVPAWLALGLLLSAPKEAAEDQAAPSALIAWWAALTGGLLVRSLVFIEAYAALLILLCVIVLLSAMAGLTRRMFLGVIGLWIFGALTTLIHLPELISLALIASVGVLFIHGPYDNTLLPRRFKAVYAIVVLVAFTASWADMTSDAYLRLALTKTDAQAAADHARYAALLRPWDGNLAANAGSLALTAAIEPPLNAVRLAQAQTLLSQALALNRFDSEYGLRMAMLAHLLEGVTPEAALYHQQAAHYFAASARLFPADPLIWQRWLLFQWDGVVRIVSGG